MAESDPSFEALLDHLKTSRGFDFTGYKRTSLMRRVQHRMGQIEIADYGDYLDYLELHSDEFTALFNTILINVTGFFRDAEAWDFLRTSVLPDVLADKAPTAALRVWCAGCASGEEAYTLAIVLAEMMGIAEFRDRVKIYATDVDEDALNQARHGSYSPREIRGIPSELLEKYFEPAAGRYVFRKDLRRSVIFGRNDLVQDAPISRIDLLLCRNTLMYFTAETQARILGRFHFALTDGGVLFLGKAEMLLSHGATFMPIDLRRRTFRKVPRSTVGSGPSLSDPARIAHRPEPAAIDALRAEALLADPLAQVVVAVDGLVAAVNRQAEFLFGLSVRDVGRPFRDLDLSYRPLELRRYIEQAQSERRIVRVSDVLFTRGPEQMVLEIQISPLVGVGSTVLGVGVAFHDVTESRRLQDELEQANRQLETAYEELQSTNEELETTNEELQSTNEELETMNEELRSTNDELQTINDELHDRTGELDRLNDFLDSILTSLQAGVVVLDPELRVQVWNEQAQELWGLRREEAAGQHFLNLDIGLPTDQVRPIIRRVLGGEDGPQEITLKAVNRRGRTVVVRVQGSPLSASGRDPGGVILTMEHLDPAVDGRVDGADGDGTG